MARYIEVISRKWHTITYTRADALYVFICLAGGEHRPVVPSLSGHQECVLQRLEDIQMSGEEMKGICQTQGVGSALGAKLAPVPWGAPVTAHWHVVRNNVVDAVRGKLCDPEGPWMVGIVGQSGSGKTTAATAIVSDNVGKVLPCNCETHKAARERVEQVRRYFHDGVLWLRVGRGAGMKSNLPSLILQLATMVNETLTDNCDPGRAPTNQEGGTATVEFVRKKVASGNGGKGYRCLLVADDVWEPEVVAQLQKTGMRVLLTTRKVELVLGFRDSELVRVNELTPAEAEAALRGAAELHSNVPLPQSAYDVIQRCDWWAMYVAHVAKFEYLKGRTNEKAWKKALDAIDQNLEALVAEKKSCRQGGDPIADKHHAILRAGFDCQASEVMHSKLYLALGVMPDTHAFAAYEAAVLLFGHEYDYSDLERAEEVVRELERWAIVRVDGAGLYRMHDDLRDFAKRTLREHGHIQRTVVSHWRDHLSTLDALRSVDLLVLLGLWQALEKVGGEGWRTSRPYDKAVAEMDPSDPTYFASVKVLVSLYQLEGDLGGADDLMVKVLERNERLPNANPLVIANALCWRVAITRSRGQRREAQQLRTRLKELVDSVTVHCCRGGEPTGGLEESLSLHTLGSLCLTTRRLEEAEHWFRQALKAYEALKLGKYHAQVGATLQGLAHCVQHDSGRQKEAEALLHRAIDIVKMRRGPDSLVEASTLSFLAICELDANRPQRAEKLFRRALDIYRRRNAQPARLEANALHSLAVCIREMGRWQEAERLLQRSLGIQCRVSENAKLDILLACTLRELALCARADGRPERAETFFRRAVRIEENMGLRSSMVIRVRRPENAEPGTPTVTLS